MEVKKIHIETDVESKQILAGYPNQDGNAWGPNVQNVTDTVLLSVAKFLSLGNRDANTGASAIEFEYKGVFYKLACKSREVTEGGLSNV